MVSRWVVFVCACWMFHQQAAWAKHVVHRDASRPSSEKTALLIMNGFGGTRAGCRAQMAFWEDRGMDVFIPDVLQRKSLEASSQAMRDFMLEEGIAEYGEIKAICYIAGAYLLHAELAAHPLPQLTAIIYDRSPTQERAPRAVSEEMPFAGWLAMGPVLRDLAEAEWPPPPRNPDIRKGLAIENRATNIMRKLEVPTRAMGPLEYDWRSIDPSAVDAFHVALDHNMMYVRWDVLGDAFVHFFESGSFPAGLRRNQIFQDPFDKSNPIPE